MSRSRKGEPARIEVNTTLASQLIKISPQIIGVEIDGEDPVVVTSVVETDNRWLVYFPNGDPSDNEDDESAYLVAQTQAGRVLLRVHFRSSCEYHNTIWNGKYADSDGNPKSTEIEKREWRR